MDLADYYWYTDSTGTIRKSSAPIVVTPIIEVEHEV